MNSRIRIRRKARIVLAGHADQLDRALIDQLVKREDVITRDAKDMLDAKCPEALDQVFADRDRAGSAFAPAPFPPAFGAPSRFGFLGVDVPDINGLQRPVHRVTQRRPPALPAFDRSPCIEW